MRLVVFDVDGTLVDSQDHIVEAQHRAFAACGLAAPTRERALSVVGLSLPEAFTALVGRDGPVDALCQAYVEAWGQMRVQPDFREHLYAGADELIHTLGRSPDLRLALATGKSRKGVNRLLATFGWSALFCSTQTADEHPSKPDPAMLLACVHAAGVDPADAVMVGDTTFDVAMASAAGVASVAVTWGYHSPIDLAASNPTHLVGSFAELAVVLSEIGAR